MDHRENLKSRQKILDHLLNLKGTQEDIFKFIPFMSFKQISLENEHWGKNLVYVYKALFQWYLHLKKYHKVEDFNHLTKLVIFDKKIRCCFDAKIPDPAYRNLFKKLGFYFIGHEYNVLFPRGTPHLKNLLKEEKHGTNKNNGSD